ncbi:hypothetical protein BH11MYX2_BH11MYX2_11940 [soil metagenome]
MSVREQLPRDARVDVRGARREEAHVDVAIRALESDLLGTRRESVRVLDTSVGCRARQARVDLAVGALTCDLFRARDTAAAAAAIAAATAIATRRAGVGAAVSVLAAGCIAVASARRRASTMTLARRGRGCGRVSVGADRCSVEATIPVRAAIRIAVTASFRLAAACALAGCGERFPSQCSSRFWRGGTATARGAEGANDESRRAEQGKKRGAFVVHTSTTRPPHASSAVPAIYSTRSRDDGKCFFMRAEPRSYLSAGCAPGLAS